MSQYTYYITDLLSGLIVGDLPFYGVKCDWYLTNRGTFEGKLKITDPDVAAMGALNLDTPGKNGVWVDYNGQIIWGGIIWITAYDSENAELTVTAADFWSFFWRRVAATSVNVTSTEIMTIVNSIIANDGLSDHIPANLSVAHTSPPGVTVTPQLIDYTYSSADRKMVGELIEGLADMTPGFELRSEAFWARAGIPGAAIVIGQSRLGLPTNSTGAEFDYPGSCTKYTFSSDASRHAARVYVRGTSTGVEQPELIYEDTTLYTLYPRYDDVNAIDENTFLALSARGQYIFNNRRRRRDTFEVKVRPDIDPQIGTYKPGDDVQVNITDARFPSGYVQTLRIAGMSLDVDNQEVTIIPWLDVDA